MELRCLTSHVAKCFECHLEFVSVVFPLIFSAAQYVVYSLGYLI
jgi:hypothetical protein